jgi:hypothetical protein
MSVSVSVLNTGNEFYFYNGTFRDYFFDMKENLTKSKK